MKNTFTKNSRLCLCISGAIIALALILQVVGLGLNLGIDFTGGSILEYSVGENYDVADVEAILSAVGFDDAHVTKAAPSAASVALQANLAAEEAEEETSAETTIISMDKSGVKEDGLTDLQIRLALVDEAANMEACAVEAVKSVNFDWKSYEEASAIYDPAVLTDGYHTVNGEEIFYISNPALGLWTRE